MARITIIGPDGRHERELGTHNTLGRHPNNTHQVLDRIVSKEHCHIDLIDGSYILKDLGSLNGTFVNGERVSERPLRNGDEITLGSTRIVFSQAAEEVTGPATAPNGGAAQAETMASPGVASPGFRAPTPGEKPDAPSKVTIAPGMVESHIRTKLAPLLEQNFLPERLVQDGAALRRDYEKLRASYELMRAIGVELEVDKLLAKILEVALELLSADRGVVLLYDDEGELSPASVRTKKGNPDEEVVLSTTIIEEVLRDKAAVLSSDASVDSRFQGAHSIIMQGIRSSMAVPLLHGDDLIGIMLLDSQIAANAFTEKDLQLFQNVANQAAIAVQNSLFAKKLQQEAVTRERFQRLLSPAIAEQVVNGKVEVKKGGEVRETTVLFSDIRGFTAMSETVPAQEVVDMLNDYFELMVEIIFENEGTLDKFVGDEIMALFGAPIAHPDDPLRAVRTAMKMLDVLEKEFNTSRRAAGKPELKIGIGINTGEVVAGYLGSSKALEYTVIGDTVNTGARLCSAAKAGQCLISEWTYERVKDQFEVIELPAAQVKGKAKALKLYNVVGFKGESQVWDDRTRPA
ncbi:MAG: adenylate cyclase [Sandaracinus sp.]|nr:adenylate cyclase [Sandaracinus sp.]|tara:strand:- start:102 stop:1823 length:1722 start_codon:yes stop_codon:yes gene_type:complete